MGALLDRIATDRSVLWLDPFAYSARRLAGGSPKWLELDASIAWLGQTQKLLSSDVGMLPVGRIVDTWLDAHPALLEAMAAKRRAVAPLRTALADEDLRSHLVATARALRSSQREGLLVIALPSPRRWLALAYGAAFAGESLETDPDTVDSAATYVADFLRTFAECGFDALLLEEDERSDPRSADDVAAYGAVGNVASYYRWDLGVRLSPRGAAIEGPRGIGFWVASSAVEGLHVGILVPDGYWTGDPAPDPPPDGFRFAEIPADGTPETVLERLAALRAPRS